MITKVLNEKFFPAFCKEMGWSCVGNSFEGKTPRSWCVWTNPVDGDDILDTDDAEFFPSMLRRLRHKYEDRGFGLEIRMLPSHIVVTATYSESSSMSKTALGFDDAVAVAMVLLHERVKSDDA